MTLVDSVILQFFSISLIFYVAEFCFFSFHIFFDFDVVCVNRLIEIRNWIWTTKRQNIYITKLTETHVINQGWMILDDDGFLIFFSLSKVKNNQKKSHVYVWIELENLSNYHYHQTKSSFNHNKICFPKTKTTVKIMDISLYRYNASMMEYYSCNFFSFFL